METLLVIGASGLLGQHLTHQGRGSYREVLGTYCGNPFRTDGVEALKLDIVSEEEVFDLFQRRSPDHAIIASALTGVDYCEEHPEEAKALNENGPRNIAKACKEHGTKLLHVSTDYVFDGGKGNYKESDEPNPINIYGQTKLGGERAVLDSAPDSLVARVCVLYGWNRITPKSNFVTWVMDKMEAEDPIKLFQDQTITPTYADEVSRILLELISKDGSGVFHASGSQAVSRYEMGKLIAKAFGLKEGMVIPISMSDAGLAARRPTDSSLNVEKIEEELNMRMHPIHASLEHMRDNR
jgi:dTDP-4-dehydrorhamnose reductase